VVTVCATTESDGLGVPEAEVADPDRLGFAVVSFVGGGT
jgi:hypothetical protein